MTSAQQLIPAADLDEVESAIPGLPLAVRRLSTADGGVGLAAQMLGDVAVIAGQFGFPVATEGDIAQDSLVVAVQLEEGCGSWDGEEFHLDRAWYYYPGSEHVGVGRSGPGSRPPRFAVISVDAELIRSARDHDGSALPRTARTVTDRRVAVLRSAVLDVLGAGELTPAHAERARRDMMEIVTGLEAGLGDVGADRTSAMWITEECIALADALGPTASTADLAATIGVSDRWVRAAFQRVYGVSAAAFFKARAIDGAHRELVASRPESTSVTDVAMRWGFWHLGRFSSTYRSYFGELPSETLHRLP